MDNSYAFVMWVLGASIFFAVVGWFAAAELYYSKGKREAFEAMQERREQTERELRRIRQRAAFTVKKPSPPNNEPVCRKIGREAVVSYFENRKAGEL